MATTPQTRAVKNYRKRLSQRGLARFDVLGLDSDRELVRSLARRLAENDQLAAEIRLSVREKIALEPHKKGAIYEALRSWPIADLDLTREYTEGREIDL